MYGWGVAEGVHGVQIKGEKRIELHLQVGHTTLEGAPMLVPISGFCRVFQLVQDISKAGSLLIDVHQTVEHQSDSYAEHCCLLLEEVGMCA